MNRSSQDLPDSMVTEEGALQSAAGSQAIPAKDAGQVHYETCLALLVEVAAMSPAAKFVSNSDAAARVDMVISSLKYAVPTNASELLLQALSLEPASAYGYTAWGLVLAKTGELEKALCAFDTAIDLDNKFLLAICGKIMLLNALGRREGLGQEILLLRRQLTRSYQEIAKFFIPLLAALGEPPENEAKFVNIGGGPHFDHWYWRNLESVHSENNPDPIRFSPDCVFPLKDEAVEFVYTSHCLEHLDDPTVARVLTEARRIVRSDGALLVKIPDFDKLLNDWRRQDPSLICEPVWGLEPLLPMWEARGVEDTLDNRAAIIFSGFWNHAYGDENRLYSDEGEHEDGAYLGPPVLPGEVLRDLADRATPHEIAAILRQHIVDNEPNYHFNHQNAWSRNELYSLLMAHKFSVLSFDREKIIQRYHWIPQIEDMDHMSMYCVAVPV